MIPRVLSLALLFAGGMFAQDYPRAEISNGLIRAKLYLPDAQHGSYLGTRFDWSGIIYSLQYSGHEYFGKWYDRPHDPKIHDAITGPVESFNTNDAGLGYDEAKAGGTFVRIGVGVVRKPDEPKFQGFKTYEVLDPGKWTVNKQADRIEFTQELKSDTGYAYLYKKTVRLVKDKPELVLEHSLTNTGQKAIDTSVFNHNFFVIDGEVVGPDLAVTFPFEPRPAASFKGLASVRGEEIAYTHDLQKGESVFSELEGYGGTPESYKFDIQNRKTGAGVRIGGDQPLSKLVFWSIRTVACPEPYIHMNIAPGETSKWTITYDFYTQSGVAEN